MRSLAFSALALRSAAAFAACSDQATTPHPTSSASGAGGSGGGGPEPTHRPVNPVPPLFIGSGGIGYSFGSAFAGALAPQGLAKIGPDTKGPWGTINFLHYSGYWYGDDIIQGFSHLHLHGTGATDYGVLAVMPTDAFDASRTTKDG